MLYGAQTNISQNRLSELHDRKSVMSFPWINNERIRKGQFLDWYEVGNEVDFHVPALRCIYTIMKTCSEQPSLKLSHKLLFHLEPF